MKYTAVFLLQVILVWSNIRELEAMPSQTVDCPPPKVGAFGDIASVKVVVKERQRGMSNMYTYGVKLKKETTHTMYNNGSIYALRDGVQAIFNGRQICISVKKVSILDQSGTNEAIVQKCEHRCFGINETVVQVTRVEEGGNLLAKKIRGLCCVWSTETWLEISPQKPSYKCLRCSGEECHNNVTKLVECAPGVECFSMIFTMKLDNKTTTYGMKGCANHKILRGRRCWDGCRKMAVNYKMCIECCHGDLCNSDKENSTEIPTHVPSKMFRVGAGSQEIHSSCSPVLLVFLFLLFVVWI